MIPYRIAGAKARREGLSRDKNPYRRNSDKYHAWDDGWIGKSQHFRQPYQNRSTKQPFKL